MRPWTVTLEALLMVFLWLLNAVGDIILCFGFFFFHSHGGYIMTGVLGLMHFVLNVWVIHMQWRNMHKCILCILFITQTAPFVMLCQRAWRSMTCCARDKRTKKRGAVVAKYSLCCTSWKSTKKQTSESSSFTQGSCVPSDFMPNTDSISTAVPMENTLYIERDEILDKILLQEETISQPETPVATTKFRQNTHDIVMNFSASQDLYFGEPKLIKFLMKKLQALLVDEKKLSYHIVTDPKNIILYTSKSDKHIGNLPDQQIVGRDGISNVICNDIHYALNMTKAYGYETFAVTRRTLEETQFFIVKDLSKGIWCLVWPSAVFKLYTLLDMMVQNQYFISYLHGLVFLSPAFSIITWLFTQKGVSEPWRNTLILIPLRLSLTVTRALLVVGISLSSIVLASVCYVTAKLVGLGALTTYLAYMKKYRSIELYSDDIVKYNFHPMYQPIVQVCESVVYVAWAIWWYSVSPLGFGTSDYTYQSSHYYLVVLLATVIGNIIGLVWLWRCRSLLKQPLTDPASVLKNIVFLEFVAT
ncbi:hypothetical protein SK128_013051 [Halocaridina rubra]|uniref:Uncharacterized protein n=1 Tax=Halocaridina rubra TaxID=373956 RepID=A0AAN9A051_HALRR